MIPIGREPQVPTAKGMDYDIRHADFMDLPGLLWLLLREFDQLPLTSDRAEQILYLIEGRCSKWRDEQWAKDREDIEARYAGKDGNDPGIWTQYILEFHAKLSEWLGRVGLFGKDRF